MIPDFQHVGDAGRDADIIFEHMERFRIDPHDVNAGDRDVDVVRHSDWPFISGRNCGF